MFNNFISLILKLLKIGYNILNVILTESNANITLLL